MCSTPPPSPPPPGYTTIGCVVLFLHDPSSIWLKATRILERAKGEARGCAGGGGSTVPGSRGLLRDQQDS